MNVRDEILGQLRARRPFREIRKEVHSISKLYEAGRQYLDELEVALEAKRVEISELEEERSDREVKVEGLRAGVAIRKEESQKLEQEIARQRSDISVRNVELNFVQAEIDRFREQGFSSEIMQKLTLLLERGGPKLLEQVETIQKYHSAMKEFSVLNRRITRLRKEARDLIIEKRRAQDSKVSLENQIDELRLQVRSIKDAADNVVWLLKKGYTVEDIRALGYGLEFLGVDGDPDCSVTRLVKALKRQSGLMVLEERVRRKSIELADLEGAIEDAKTRFRVEEEVTLRSINEVRDTSVQSIQRVSETGRKALTVAQSGSERQLQAFMEDFAIKANERIQWIDERARQQSELVQQKAVFKETLAWGQFLQNLMGSDQYLSTVPLTWILRLSCRLHLWIKMKLPKEEVLPSSSMMQRQLGLMSLPYNLTILAELFCSGLEAASSRAREPVKTDPQVV